MTFLYVLTKYLTFPGAYVRCMWEQIICRIIKVPVEDNRYMRDDEVGGHVEHELAEKPRGAFALCFVPALFNSIGIFWLLIFPVFLRAGSAAATIFSCFSVWFALSLFCNSFPMIEDAINMYEKVYKKGNILQKIFYTPAMAIVFVGAYLERYCITFIIGVAAIICIFI